MSPSPLFFFWFSFSATHGGKNIILFHRLARHGMGMTYLLSTNQTSKDEITDFRNQTNFFQRVFFQYLNPVFESLWDVFFRRRGRFFKCVECVFYFILLDGSRFTDSILIVLRVCVVLGPEQPWNMIKKEEKGDEKKRLMIASDSKIVSYCARLLWNSRRI